MKATGIVRRIDDLGRVVIPKEIRRTLRIKGSTVRHGGLRNRRYGKHTDISRSRQRNGVSKRGANNSLPCP